MAFDGVLVIDKPSGPTSFDVVRRVRSALGTKKVGHTGTLDPLATGVLPICLGEATKLAGLVTAQDKAYDAVVRLGQETDTHDAQGKVVAEGAVPPLDAAKLEEALARFRGTYLQTPPMFSAVKVNGRRLYELARAGEEVERAAREVTVHALELRDFSATEVQLSVRCSKGFFVRTLAFELGRALGCGGHISALRRTASGRFTLQDAVPLQEVEEHAQTEEGKAWVSGRLVSLAEALSDLDAVSVSAEQQVKVEHGVPLDVTSVHPERSRGARVRVLSPDGQLLALATVEQGKLRYSRVFGRSA